MNTRLATLLALETADTATTKTIDIDTSDVISKINIQFKAMNNGSTLTAHPAAVITKAELVDGSDVLTSLNGYELDALSFYHTGVPSFRTIEYRNDVYNIMNYEINFGRWLHDPNLALDPKKFNNLQLKITHDKALGGTAPDAGYLEVTANIFDEKKVSPMGYLMAKEHYKYTLSSGAYEYVDLPIDHPMKMLMVQSLYTGKQPWEQYNEIKVSEDNDKRIPIDDKTSDLLKYMVTRYGPFQEKIMSLSTTGAVSHYVTPTYETSVVATPLLATAGYFASAQSYGGTAAIKGNAALNFQANIFGYAPHGAIALPFGDPKDMADWYDTTKLRNLKLRLKAGSSVGSSSTCQVITQQYRRY